MADLFSDFNITTARVPQNHEPEINFDVSSDVVLSELTALAESQRDINKHFRHFDYKLLHPGYLSKVLEHYRATGKFCYICARCFKPIVNPKKIVLNNGLLFGKDCFSSIQQRQEWLRWVYVEGRPSHPMEPDQLQEFQCSTSGVKFKANPDIVGYCGGNHRTCAQCPGTGLRVKGSLCDLEKAIWAQRPETKA